MSIQNIWTYLLYLYKKKKMFKLVKKLEKVFYTLRFSEKYSALIYAFIFIFCIHDINNLYYFTLQEYMLKVTKKWNYIKINIMFNKSCNYVKKIFSNISSDYLLLK